MSTESGFAFAEVAPVLRRQPRAKVGTRHARLLCKVEYSSNGNCVRGDFSRRTFGKLAAAVAVSALLPKPAEGITGLQAFPLFTPLTNTYYFMRAGESVSLAKGEIRTNPVEKSSIPVHGLTPRGVDQVLVAAEQLKVADVGPTCWIWASQNQACQESADLLAYQLQIRREQIVPEFAFLDARGVGASEGLMYKDVHNSLAKMDSENIDLRLPPGEDGTPTESVADIFVRVRQLMSKLETQYNGETIVVIAPDSDLLSVLECALRNEPLTQHAKFEYSPGELRKVDAVVVPKYESARKKPRTT